MALIFSLIVIVYILIPLPGNFRYLGAAVIVGLFLLIMLPSTLRSREMENSGVHVTGVVISKDCSKIKNQIVKYRFNVHGIYYENSSKPGQPLKPSATPFTVRCCHAEKLHPLDHPGASRRDDHARRPVQYPQHC